MLPNSGAHIFTYEVANPSDYGILKVAKSGQPVSVIEKPIEYVSNLAITGLYFFDSKVSAIARDVKPSKRGELEITSVINHYLNSNSLTYTKLSRGATWLDTGSPNSLHDASSFVRVLEERTGLKVACLEEIALANGWISIQELEIKTLAMGRNQYSHYLIRLLDETKALHKGDM